MNSSVIFRRPEFSDADEVAAVHVRCWQQAYDRLMDAEFLRTLSVPQRTAQWKRAIEDPEVFTRVAVVGLHVVGFVMSGPVREAGPQWGDGEIYALYVLAENHRQGIGRALLTAAIADWRSRGGRAVVALVVSRNAGARAFYRANGAVEQGEVAIELASQRLNETICVFATS